MLKINNLTKGIGMALLGYLAIALMSSCGKTVASHQVPTSTIVFFQYSISLLLTLPTIFKQGISSLKTNHLGLMLLRCLTGLTSSAALFCAINYIPLVNAVLLQNTAPLFVPIIIWLWLRKTINRQLWWGIMVGFIGVIFILKPNAQIIHPASFIGLTAGILSSISLVSISLLKQTEPTNRILFYSFFPSSLIMLPLALMHPIHFTWPIIAGLIGVGIFMYLSQMLITMAFHYGKTTILAPMCYSVVVFSGLLGWLFWHHVPDWINGIGIALVCAGGIITIALEQRSKPVTATTNTEQGQAKTLPV